MGTLEVDAIPLILGQDGAAGLPGETVAVPGDPDAGTAGTGAGGRPSPSSPVGGSQFLLLMLAIVVIMVIVSTMSTRREKKKREAMIGAIKKHDRVQTVGGVIGAIVELKPDTVVLKVDESANTRITFARSAIQQVLSSSDEGRSTAGK